MTSIGNIAFVGLEDGSVKSYDLVSGQPIDSISFDGIIEDLGLLEKTLYVLEDAKTNGKGRSRRSRIHSIPTSYGRFSDENGPFLPRNSVDTPGVRQWGLGNGIGRRLFVGDEFAYVTDLMGFNRIDLSHPIDPSLEETVRTASRGWRQTIANGSGLALGVEHRNSPRFARADPSVYTIQKDGSFLRIGGAMENFETRFITPGNAGSIAIYNGLAYVADGRNGLQVVNYKAFDINGISPTLQVSLDQSEEAIESSTLSIRAFVQDDIQVRNVEFHIDGSRAFTDGGYPFSHEHQVPLYQNQSSIRIRVLARDTGGNVAYWPGPSPDSELVLPIAEDLTPEIVTYFPRENHSVFADSSHCVQRKNGSGVHQHAIRPFRANQFRKRKLPLPHRTRIGFLR